MAANQLIATLDCFKQEIILDVPGETVDGTFTAYFPDGSTQSMVGVLPISLSTSLAGQYTFIEDSIIAINSTVSTVLPVSLNAKFTDCANISELSICLFNLNLRYEQAKCNNEKEAFKEKQKLDRALQLIALQENVGECGLDNLQKYRDEFISITNCDECEKLDDDIWGDYAVYGCTDPTAPNYNPAANIDDGSCLGTSITGCTNPTANNYNANATIDDGSCTFDIYGCTDSTATNYDPNATVNDGSCIASVYGCTDPTASNYNPLANVDDGSCIAVVYGCTDSTALNYNANATVDDGSCVYAGASTCANNDTTVSNGNTFNTYINYDSTALYDCNGEALGTTGDSSTGPQNTGYDSCCIASIFGCTDPTAFNYIPNATVDDGSCQSNVYGCTDPTALNYSPGANTPDPGNPCCYVAGCMDTTASNYDPNACYPDGSCLYCNIYGCTDPTASNYDPLADCDDGSCIPNANPCTGTTNVPDSAFEARLENAGYGDGTTGNNTILNANCCTETTVNVASFSCYDATGIEAFVDAEVIYLQGNHNWPRLSICDLTANTKLKSIYMYKTHLTSIDFNNNPDLEIISMSQGQLQSLDLTTNIRLKMLWANSQTFGLAVMNGALSSITGLSNLVDLEAIEIAYNSFTSLDFTNNTKLYWVVVSYNQLTNLNVSTLTLLERLECAHGQFSNLDITNCPLLINLDAKYNQGITSLDTSNNTDLTIINLRGCQNLASTGIDFSNNTNLQRIVINHMNHDNPDFTTLNVSMCTQLTYLDVQFSRDLGEINLGADIDLSTLHLNAIWCSGTATGPSSYQSNLTIHVGTAGRVAQAQALWPGTQGSGTLISGSYVSPGTTFTI